MQFAQKYGIQHSTFSGTDEDNSMQIAQTLPSHLEAK